MRTPPTLLRSLFIASTCAYFTGSAHALSCEELRATVEAKIRSNGVTSSTIEIVDASATVTGQVVGSCERGAKKLTYKASGNAQQASRAIKPTQNPASSPRSRVITECADGRVITQGSCKP